MQNNGPNHPEKNESNPEMTKTSPKENVTDLEFLKEFCNGDTERMKKYISIYLKSTPANLEKISIAKESNDFETLKLTVHSMKPHLSFMGMTKDAKIAAEIEAQCLKNAASRELDDLLALLIQDCKRSIEELNLSLQTI
jgi:HPt (histidine-containing phosphotransfer) domain-containing protein